MPDATLLISVGAGIHWDRHVLLYLFFQVRGYSPDSCHLTRVSQTIKPEVIINNEWSEKS